MRVSGAGYFGGDLAGRSYYVSAINEGANFTIQLSGNLPDDVDFDWWLIDTDDSGEEIQSGLTGFLVPPP